MRTRTILLILVCVAFNGFGQNTDSTKTANPPGTAATNQPSIKRIRVNQGVLKPTRMVQPQYPESARETPTNGIVSLKVIIGIDGAVKDVQFISGDDRLASNSIAAVKKWEYKPLTVGGVPVEVETQVDVKFSKH